MVEKKPLDTLEKSCVLFLCLCLGAFIGYIVGSSRQRGPNVPAVAGTSSESGAQENSPETSTTGTREQVEIPREFRFFRGTVVVKMKKFKDPNFVNKQMKVLFEMARNIDSIESVELQKLEGGIGTSSPSKFFDISDQGFGH